MKFYKSVKFKAIVGTLLLAAILCAAFIRIVPDYSTSKGFVVVSLPVQQIQARILPKRE